MSDTAPALQLAVRIGDKLASKGFSCFPGYSANGMEFVLVVKWSKGRSTRLLRGVRVTKEGLATNLKSNQTQPATEKTLLGWLQPRPKLPDGGNGGWIHYSPEPFQEDLDKITKAVGSRLYETLHYSGHVWIRRLED